MCLNLKTIYDKKLKAKLSLGFRFCRTISAWAKSWLVNRGVFCMVRPWRRKNVAWASSTATTDPPTFSGRDSSINQNRKEILVLDNKAVYDSGWMWTLVLTRQWALTTTKWVPGPPSSSSQAGLYSGWRETWALTESTREPMLTVSVSWSVSGLNTNSGSLFLGGGGSFSDNSRSARGIGVTLKFCPKNLGN